MQSRRSVLATAAAFTVLGVLPASAQRQAPEMTPQDTMRMWTAMSGEQARLLISSDLALDRDQDQFANIVVPTASLLSALGVILGKGERRSSGFISSVTDGRKSHSITLYSFDAATDSFRYWEPWGRGSFLEAEHNVAGVSARPDPAQRKFFFVTRAELAQVLHSTMVQPRYAMLLNAIAPIGTFGSLGDTLASAREAHLFKWFHLEETGSRQGPGALRSVEHRPGGAKFRALASLAATVDGKDRLLDLELILDRSFIDNRQTSPFAADIAKSFLAETAHKRDRSIVGPIVNELERGQPRHGAAPEPGPAVKVFRGLAPSYESLLTSSRLLIAGHEDSGLRRLSIRLATSQ